MTDYIAAKATQQVLNEEVDKCSLIMNQYPKGDHGVIPDYVRKSVIWKMDKRNLDTALKNLRSFNKIFMLGYKKELYEERKKKWKLRAAKLAEK